MRRPITRLAYWIGIRRWPSCTKTIAAITASAMNGIMTLKTGSELVDQACTPLGRPATIEAKIISEMPLPMPRWVISSPIHMRSTQPAVSEMTIRKTRAALKFSMIGCPALAVNERKRKT